MKFLKLWVRNTVYMLGIMVLLFGIVLLIVRLPIIPLVILLVIYLLILTFLITCDTP